MSYTANIIYFSSRADALKIKEKLTLAGIKSELLPVRKCLITDDISEYFVFDRNSVGSLEKNYLRDGKTRPAALLSIQKIILDRLLSETVGNSLFFVEESFIPECFYIKKALFRNGISFFSFGRIAPEFGLSVVRGSLDAGFHEASFLSVKEQCSNAASKPPVFPEFNGILAIDARRLIPFQSDICVFSGVRSSLQKESSAFTTLLKPGKNICRFSSIRRNMPRRPTLRRKERCSSQNFWEKEAGHSPIFRNFRSGQLS